MKSLVVVYTCLLLLTVTGIVQTQNTIVNTKHNLSVAGPGTIKAASETQVCVFCHTPHSPQPIQPLWNHQLSTADYILYSSEYLTSLSYSIPNQPNPRSKLCLSCHDGTIALGAVYNNMGTTTIAMQNDITVMPSGIPSNIGTSLVNDHPVGYIYDNAKDPELVARPWPWNTPVKLDPDASNGTVECHTCHEPHNNQFGKFLRMDNTNAALCTFCHTKTNWSQAVHKTSTQAYTPSGGTQTTIGEWSCRSCHTSHAGEGVPYLLTSSEENTCFTSGCHGSDQTGMNTKNIQSEYQKMYAHPTTTVSGKHKNPDNSASLNTSNRHAECQDCHNGHQAQKGLHTIKSNLVSNVLKGVSGVIPQSTPRWTQPTTFVQANPALQENQICFKCHSYNAFGVAVDGVTTIVGPSGGYITDQAMEFNPENRSAHPVQVSLNNQTGSPAPKALSSSQMTSSWNSVGTQTMYCSDCHGNDQAASATIPQGPHGSNNKFLLTGNAKYWPKNASGTLWSLNDIKNNSNNWQNDLFCVNCHPMISWGSFVNNVHNTSNHQRSDVYCITCHVVVPHGSKRSRLIGYSSDVSPYNYNGAGQYEKLVIAGFRKASFRSGYSKSNCSTPGLCHGTQTGSYED